MRVYDVVAELKLDVLDLAGRFELIYQRCLISCLWRNGVFSFVTAGRLAARGSSLQVAVHEVDLLQPAKALADVLRPDLSNALHHLEL